MQAAFENCSFSTIDESFLLFWRNFAWRNLTTDSSAKSVVLFWTWGLDVSNLCLPFLHILLPTPKWLRDARFTWTKISSLSEGLSKGNVRGILAPAVQALLNGACLLWNRQNVWAIHDNYLYRINASFISIVWSSVELELVWMLS